MTGRSRLKAAVMTTAAIGSIVFGVTGAAAAATPLPAHVYAPYFEA